MSSQPLFDAMSRISNSLAFLAQQCQAEAQAGMTTRNKIAENILLPVLRKIHGVPGLSSTSNEAANFPGIDLFDQQTGFGVQITSETRAAKITGTLSTVIGERLPVRHLNIVLVSQNSPRYTSASRVKWRNAVRGRFQFEPDDDIVDFGHLLRKILGLAPADVLEIANDLELFIQGKSVPDLIAFLSGQARAQLATEIRNLRYIPDVFVEKVSTKYHARCFAHPTLFLPRIAEWLGTRPLWGLNATLRQAGLPAINEPAPPASANLGLTDSDEAASQLKRILQNACGAVDEYAEVKSGAPRPPSLAPERAHAFDELWHRIRNGVYGWRREVDDRFDELACVRKQIFMLVGRAGQGKTNFLCDFVDRFMLRHEIPCAYIAARQLSRLPEPDLTEAVRKLIFPPQVGTFDEGMRLITAECARLGKPFVLVIDGLNEHRDIATFSGQMEYLLSQLVGYPHAKALLTCRSEFFEDRFGGLLRGELQEHVFLSQAHGHRLDDEEFDELVMRYFAFFGVDQSLVSESVLKALQSDILMLRFFCEAYGARGRPADYRQPRVTRVYRDAVFGEYLRRKLERADNLVADRADVPKPVGQREGTRRVLTTISEHMVRHAQYSDVPAEILPLELHDALYALLDEELILRRDVASAQSVLDTPAEVINFTFDALRDYILAQYLVQVFRRAPAEFDGHLASQGRGATQSVEGIQQFLFYAARDPENADFLRHYESLAWYASVYDTEVFYLRPEYLSDGDREKVVGLLREGGPSSWTVAGELAVRWEEAAWPVLNLSLFLEVATSSDDQFYAAIIQPVFGNVSWHGQPTLNQQLCKFAMTTIDDLSPSTELSLKPVFRLTALLLPMDETYNLESPGVGVFRALAMRHAGYAGSLLVDAISDRTSWNQPFVWRLLGEMVNSIPDVESLRRQAQLRIQTGVGGDVVQRELRRFVEQARAIGSDS